jgi:hypothetical protein
VPAPYVPQYRTGDIRECHSGGPGTELHSNRMPPAGQLGGGRVVSVDGPRADDTLSYTYDELERIVTRFNERRKRDVDLRCARSSDG